jgi:hypothetical protein
VANACREPVAEKVQDKTRSNFCGYFRPKVDAYIAPDAQQDTKARAELEALFGLEPGAASGAGGGRLTAAEEARRKLDELFKK